MALTVLALMTFCGGFSSTSGSLAVEFANALTAVFMPTVIQPPTNSFFSLTTLKVVAVPKSISTKGAPYFLAAATQLISLSLPSSLGFSYFTLSPVFMPAPTTMGMTSR